MQYSLKSRGTNEDGKLDFVAQRSEEVRRWKGKRGRGGGEKERRKSKADERDAFPILNSTEYGIHRLIPLLSTRRKPSSPPGLMKPREDQPCRTIFAKLTYKLQRNIIRVITVCFRGAGWEEDAWKGF